MLAVAAAALLACNESDVKKYAISGTGLEDGAQVNITSDKSNWSFMLFNDGKPIQVNYDDNTLKGSDLNNKLAECDAKTDAMMQEYNATLKGSDLNNKLAECDAKTDAMMQEYNAFVSELMKLPEEEIDAKEKEYDAWIEKLRDCYLSVVEENKDNLIPVAFIRNVRSLAGPDKFNELLASDSVFAQHPYVLDLKRKIDESVARQKEAEEKKQAIIGQKFLDLEEADPDGNLHKLSEYVGQGKWVLVDFWASWCGPCKAEMPNVVNAYKKYHKKGFEVVGLSFDREKEPWVEAIKEWEMPWIHLSDLKYWKTVASDVYNVNSIPDNLLIDPEGTVVARCLRGEALEAKLAEIFK